MIIKTKILAWALGGAAAAGAAGVGVVNGVVPLPFELGRSGQPAMVETALSSAAEPAAPDAVSEPADGAQTPQQFAALPDLQSPEPETAPPPAAEPVAPAAAAAAVDDAQPEAADPTIPVFGLLRVEPDGSVLIAGTAAADATVSAYVGSRKIGEAVAAGNGDFVIVLDTPLKPGDYTIVLRADNPDGSVTTSRETALVSIPETEDDGVLALVEAPGQASRLISAGKTAAQPLETVAVEQQEEPAVAAAEQPGEPEPKSDELVVVAVEPEAPQPVATAEPAAPAQTVVPDAASDVRIEAVEIDGETVFVAGSATPGTRLRVYANNILLGETVASDGGRFLIQINRDLPVGDYVIRADALRDDGSVLVRAAVPFTREAGERVAAVAVPEARRLPETPPVVDFPDQESSNGQSVIIPQQIGMLDGPPPIAPVNGAVQEPALVSTDASVIIRRGDTLWQISRRAYGRGVKYTTIYAANDQQIEDPDRIWPGQIFAVPRESDDDDTALAEHRKLKGG